MSHERHLDDGCDVPSILEKPNTSVYFIDSDCSKQYSVEELEEIKKSAIDYIIFNPGHFRKIPTSVWTTVGIHKTEESTLCMRIRYGSTDLHHSVFLAML